MGLARQGHGGAGHTLGVSSSSPRECLPLSLFKPWAGGDAQPAKLSPLVAAPGAAPGSRDSGCEPPTPWSSSCRGGAGENAPLGVTRFHRCPVTRRTCAPEDTSPAGTHTHNSQRSPPPPTGVPESTSVCLEPAILRPWEARDIVFKESVWVPLASTSWWGAGCCLRCPTGTGAPPAPPLPQLPLQPQGEGNA